MRSEQPASSEGLGGGVFDSPASAAPYRGLFMVAPDGVLLCTVWVHERAEETDTVAKLREWRGRVLEKEALEKRGGLSLITPDASS